MKWSKYCTIFVYHHCNKTKQNSLLWGSSWFYFIRMVLWLQY